MKKIILIAILAMLLFVSSGCSEKQGSGEFSVIVYNDVEEIVFEGTFNFKPKDLLLEMMKNHEDIALKGEVSEWGFFIKEITSINSDDFDRMYWALYVNGDYSLVGISDIILVDQDVIEFKLITY